MKKIIIVLSFVLMFTGIVSASRFYDDDFMDFEDLKREKYTFAPLSSNFTTFFPNAIKKLCHSAIDYNLNRPFYDVHKEYQKTVNCILNDAFSNGPRAVLDEIEKLTTKQKTDEVDLSGQFNSKDCYFPSSETEKITVPSYRMKLGEFGFQSQCGVLEEEMPSVIKSDYSSCKVGELLITEYCGYQKFAWAKMRETTGHGQTGDQFISGMVWNQEGIHDTLKKSKRAMLDSIFLYQKFIQNYRLHSWFVIIESNLQEIKTTLSHLKDVFATYPFKFINAASPAP